MMLAAPASQTGLRLLIVAIVTLLTIANSQFSRKQHPSKEKHSFARHQSNARNAVQNSSHCPELLQTDVKHRIALLSKPKLLNSEEDAELNYFRKFRRTVRDTTSKSSTSSTNRRGKTRVRGTQSGSVSGLLLTLSGLPNEPQVEAYLGLQYASLLGSELRFMPPTGFVHKWEGVLAATTFAPVCPQRAPNFEQMEDTVALGYLHRLRRLAKFIGLQTEDCLYLNIYVPRANDNSTAQVLLPVAVVVYSESYDLGTGNSLDGSVLAAYGNNVIVTVNFRLGPLGFLSTGDDAAPGNYALLDLLAALYWLQANVAAFDGNPREVTLIGQGYGASLVHLLLISPITKGKGLFHRAIIQSGSAFSSWAMVDNAAQTSNYLASKFNCSVNQATSSSDVIRCLRTLPYDLLTSFDAPSFKYLSTFGPVVDGHSIVPKPVVEATELALSNGALRHVPLLLGRMRNEGLLFLSQSQIEYGITEARKRQVLHTYVRNNFRFQRQKIYDVLLHHYTEWERPDDAFIARDNVIELLGDGQYAAPVVRLAQRYADSGVSTYVYVFHSPSRSDLFPGWTVGIRGDDLVYVFGEPFASSGNDPVLTTAHSLVHTRVDKQIAESVMTYWSNFIATSNPNWPRRQTLAHSDTTVVVGSRFEGVEWPLYSSHGQQYLQLGTRSMVRSHYRSTKMSLWLDLLPRLHLSGGLSPRYHLLADYTRAEAFEEQGTRPLDLRALLPSADQQRVLNGEHIADVELLLQSKSANGSLEVEKIRDHHSNRDHSTRYVVDRGSLESEDAMSSATLLYFIGGIGGSMFVFNVSLLLYVCRQRKRMRRLKKVSQHVVQLRRALLPTAGDAVGTTPFHHEENSANTRFLARSKSLQYASINYNYACESHLTSRTATSTTPVDNAVTGTVATESLHTQNMCNQRSAFGEALTNSDHSLTYAICPNDLSSSASTISHRPNCDSLDVPSTNV